MEDPALNFGWSQRINMLNEGLEGKTHGDVMVRTWLKSWKASFLVVDATIMVFDEKNDFVDYFFNPYIDDCKEGLVRKIPITIDMTITERSKKYNDVMTHYLKIYNRGKQVLKIAGQLSNLHDIRDAIQGHINHLIHLRG